MPDYPCRCLQDTPGQVYGQTKVRIADFIIAQNERYLAWEQSPHRSVPMSAGDDHRVDACLFFLNPNHLKDAEVADMVQLSELVPVVPMIAKVRVWGTCSELLGVYIHYNVCMFYTSKCRAHDSTLVSALCVFLCACGAYCKGAGPVCVCICSCK